MLGVKIAIAFADSRIAQKTVQSLLGSPATKDNVSWIYMIAIDPSACQDIKTDKTDVIHCKLDDMSSVSEKLKECDVAFVVPPAHADKVKTTRKILDAIKESDVKNVVLLSTVSAEVATKENQPHLREFIDLEATIKCSACEPGKCSHHFAIIRAGFYVENLLLYEKQAQEQGELPLPIGETGKFAPVALLDVAKAASLILAQEGAHEMAEIHRNQVVTLTGPETFTGKELCERASKVLGYEIKFKDISTDKARKILEALGTVDEPEIDFLLEKYLLIKEGKANFVTSLDFRGLTGQLPMTVDSFFSDHAASFRKM